MKSFINGNVYQTTQLNAIVSMYGNNQRDHERFDLINEEHSFFGAGL